MKIAPLTDGLFLMFDSSSLSQQVESMSCFFHVYLIPEALIVLTMITSALCIAWLDVMASFSITTRVPNLHPEWIFSKGDWR